MYFLKDLIQALEELAPLALAESWDRIGLMIGSKLQPISKVLCALDINERVIEEAKKHQVECIVTHHPLLFKPLSQLDFDSSKGRLIKELICHNISVYAMHTNYDCAAGGVNDILCDKLKIQNTKVLHISHKHKAYKVAVYVPETHIQLIRDVIINQDVCKIGSYQGCTFSLKGEGTFIPLEGSNPYLGQTGALEKVQERKIEFMVPAQHIHQVVAAIKMQHPYEEPAFDIYALENNMTYSGIGRYGEFKQEIMLNELINQIKQTFSLAYLRVTTQENHPVKRAAVCSGSGAGFIQEASEVADVYITGDIKFHEAQEARALGLTVIDIGHYASENIAMNALASWINERLKGVCAISSEVNGEVIYIK